VFPAQGDVDSCGTVAPAVRAKLIDDFACALCLTISFLSAATLTLPNPERNPSGGDDARVSRRTPSIFRPKMPAQGVSTMLYVSLILSEPAEAGAPGPSRFLRGLGWGSRTRVASVGET